MKKALSPIAVLFLVLASASWAVELIEVERVEVPDDARLVPDEFVVRFRPSMGELDGRAINSLPMPMRDSLDELAMEYEVRVMKPMFRGAAARGIGELAGYHRVKIGEGESLEAAMAAYEALPWVEHVEPIGVHPVCATPNDSWYSSQWHLNQANGHDVDAAGAWDTETGDESVVVAVLDTGVRYYHKDLGGLNASPSDAAATRGNVWINWAEKNGAAGVDDDMNGYVDDWVGWDFVNGGQQCFPGEDCELQDNDPRDFNGHGTHCAGNICAINNNGYALCSPSGGWGDGSLAEGGNGVKVMCCRVGWSATYATTQIGYVRMDFCAEALYYAADNGAKIASCSWGSSDTGGIDAAVTYFINKGGLVFKAAGNSGTEVADFLCGRPDVISVAATDKDDCRAIFSNYGTWVDVSAPGVSVYSLYHSYEDPDGEYVAKMSGTSMSTPLVASVAALIWSKNPDWTADQVEQRLYETADDLDGLACNSIYAGKLGAGRVNAHAAVGSAEPALVAEFAASTTSGMGPLKVDFTDHSVGATSWIWDFGDGETSSAWNPSHIYTGPGVYTVTLTVSNSSASDTKTVEGCILVTSPSLQCDDLAGNDISHWENALGTWTAEGGYMNGDCDTRDARITSPLGPFTAATINCRVRMNAGRLNRTARILFGYTDGSNYRFIEGDDVNDTWSICQRVDGVNERLRSVEKPIGTHQWCDVVVEIADNGNATLYVEGAPLTSYRWPTAVNGRLGCGYDASNSDFGDFCAGGTGPGAVLQVTAEDDGGASQEAAFGLANSPNPFSTDTEIAFTLPEGCEVRLVVYDAAGRRVRSLFGGYYPEGSHVLSFDGRDDAGRALSAGVYFYCLRCGGRAESRKMLVWK
jgi:subtilisin family serine protease